jgi:hypothetical protein
LLYLGAQDFLFRTLICSMITRYRRVSEGFWLRIISHSHTWRSHLTKNKKRIFCLTKKNNKKQSFPLGFYAIISERHTTRTWEFFICIRPHNGTSFVLGIELLSWFASSWKVCIMSTRLRWKRVVSFYWNEGG